MMIIFAFGSSVAAYLSDQVVVQLFGDGLRRGQTSGDLHRPLVQVLPVVVRGAQRAASHGAEDGKNTTHHRWATSHFHLRGNSARCGKKKKSIYLYMYTIKKKTRCGAIQREIRPRCEDLRGDLPPPVPLLFLMIQLSCGRRERARNWSARDEEEIMMLLRALRSACLRAGVGGKEGGCTHVKLPPL